MLRMGELMLFIIELRLLLIDGANNLFYCLRNAFEICACLLHSAKPPIIGFAVLIFFIPKISGYLIINQVRGRRQHSLFFEP